MAAAVSIEDLEQALLVMAYVIERHGPVYVPIFERLERDLETARRQVSAEGRARALLDEARKRAASNSGGRIKDNPVEPGLFLCQ